MQVLVFLTVSLVFTSATLAPQARNHHHECPRIRHDCLHQEDVDYVLSHWPRIFDTSDANWLNKSINCIVADDFVGFNEGSMFNGIVNGGINVPSRDALLQSQLSNIQFADVLPDTRGHVSVVSSFHSCDQIAFRWMYNGVATGRTKCTFTSNTVNKPMEYKGIDLLTIKKGTLQVEKVVTSADGVVFSFALGVDFSGSPICPGSSPPPPDKSCAITPGGYPPIEPHSCS